MRHASLVAWFFVVGALAVGCSCATNHPSNRRDTGTMQPDEDSSVLVVEDGQVIAPDAWFPDTGPRFDAGCSATTPVENEIVGDPPDMLILLDLSGSMCMPPGIGFGMTKLAIMKSSLTTLTSTWDSRINWGLMRFPGPADACGPGQLEVGIGSHTGAAIGSRLATYMCPGSANGNTPTHLGVGSAQSYFASIPPNPVGRYLLLATDGLPNCGAVDPSTGDTAPTVDETVAAIAALRADGVNTYVLGFGMGLGSDPAALNRMAVAGGTSTPYNARSATELDTALATIAASIIPPTCTVMLSGGTRNPDLFQVSFDGGPLIPRDTGHGSGWDYDAATNTVTFYGSECTEVEMGHVASIDIEFGCPGPLI